MVNKCCVVGCKSLYVKISDNNEKLHRFPLLNNKILPSWISITGREKGWKPGKSSRLCSNHFQKSDYIIGHGKGVLKATSIPSIEYRSSVQRYKYPKMVSSNSYKVISNKNYMNRKQFKVQPKDNGEFKIQPTVNDSNVYDNYHKIDHNYCKTNDTNDNKKESASVYGIKRSNEIRQRENQCYTNTSHFQKDNPGNTSESELYARLKKMKNIPARKIAYKPPLCSNKITEENMCSSNNSHNIGKFEHRYYRKDNDDPDRIKRRQEMCNRENQCYIFTSSFCQEEDARSITPTNETSEGLPSMNVQQSTATTSYLNSRQQSHTINPTSLKTSTEKNEHKVEEMSTSLKENEVIFDDFFSTQMKNLRSNEKLYFKTKSQIQNILKKAELKMASYKS